MSKDRPLTCFKKEKGGRNFFESPGLLYITFFHLIDVKGTVPFGFLAYIRQHVCHKNRPYDTMTYYLLASNGGS